MIAPKHENASGILRCRRTPPGRKQVSTSVTNLQRSFSENACIVQRFWYARFASVVVSSQSLRK